MNLLKILQGFEEPAGISRVDLTFCIRVKKKNYNKYKK